MPGTAHVVLIHGLWYGRISLKPMASRLQSRGRCIHRFGYPTVRRSIDANAEALASYLKRLLADDRAHDGPVHLVGHSLGGLVALHAIERFDIRPARLVLLGSPVNGSSVAHRLGRLGPLKRLVGRAAGPLETGGRRAPAGWEVGIVAGKQGLGAGRLIASLPCPHDGTVAEAETRLEGETDRLLLPVSHTGLVLSPTVADAVAHFLEHGFFERG
ncbi:alpha/beta fold hydrolase [Halomonas denitrificans]|nr:alpha/beta fold hydrolase [Halomonas denitrificans]